MKPLNSGNIVRLRLDQVEVGPRLRRVSDGQVENLLLMATDTGITTPIHVRKVGPVYWLIDGAHRMAASRKLGLPDIAALVMECRQDEARAMEASNNLGAARMSPLQVAVFAASWKRDYYSLHPDRKIGVFKGNQYSKKVVTGNSALTKAVAESFAVKERTAFDILKAGDRLEPEEVELLERSGATIALDGLVILAKIGDPEERTHVLNALAGGKVKAAAARRAWKAEKSGVQGVVKSRVDVQFLALSAAWSRASEEARKRFLEDHEAAIANRLIKIRDARLIAGRLGETSAQDAVGGDA